MNIGVIKQIQLYGDGNSSLACKSLSYLFLGYVSLNAFFCYMKSILFIGFIVLPDVHDVGHYSQTLTFSFPCFSNTLISFPRIRFTQHFFCCIMYMYMNSILFMDFCNHRFYSRVLLMNHKVFFSMPSHKIYVKVTKRTAI